MESENLRTKRSAMEQPQPTDKPKVQQKGGQQCRMNVGEDAKEHPEAPSQNSYLETSQPHVSTQTSSTDLMQIPYCMIRDDPKLGELMQQTTTCPPATPATLRELDLQSIQNNLNLRIDICFDHDLFFQPVSGRKGDAKRIEAEKYWLSLAAEFRIYHHDASGCTQCPRLRKGAVLSFERRLPRLFEILKEIVEMLIPDSEHGEVGNQLEVDFLMQQVQRGALNIVRLTEWLTGLLTSHCAPMRDCVAQEVMTDVRNGAAQSEMKLLVRGIEKLFGLLEAMKLDIANHQIRAFRYPLIEDTVPFQQDCFARAIKTGQINIKSSQLWFHRMRIDHEQDCGLTDQQQRIPPAFASFVHAMVRLCDPGSKKVPTTFRYDQQRFIRLQEDAQDLIQIDLCLTVFNRRASQLMNQHSSMTHMHEILKSRMIYLTEDEDGNGGALSDHLDAIGMEITQSIFSLMENSSHRTKTIQDVEFDQTSGMLQKVFEEEAKSQSATREFLSDLEQRTIHYAQSFLAMSTLEVSSAQRQWAQIRSSAQSGKESLLADKDDMARRLAHIGVLHWRVWADLCYLGEIDPLDFFPDDASIISTPSTYNSSTLSSPTDSHQSFSEIQQANTAPVGIGFNKSNRIDSGYSERLEENTGVLEQNMDVDPGQDDYQNTGDGTLSDKDAFRSGGSKISKGPKR